MSEAAQDVTRKWLIEYERGRGTKPWVVSRLAPGLTRSGKVPIASFASKDDAKRQIEIWEERLRHERQTAT